MTSVLDQRARFLGELLDGEIDAGSIGDLALTAESLRRQAQLGGHGAEDIAETIRRYESAIRSHRALLPDAPKAQALLAESLDALRAFAATSLARRDAEQGEDLLRAVDAVLALARAALTADVMTTTELEALAVEAGGVVRQLAPRLPDLWDLADARVVQLGEDPDHPSLYGWIEALARLSPRRAATGSVVRSAFAGKKLDRAAERAHAPWKVSWGWSSMSRGVPPQVPRHPTPSIDATWMSRVPVVGAALADGPGARELASVHLPVVRDGVGEIVRLVAGRAGAPDGAPLGPTAARAVRDAFDAAAATLLGHGRHAPSMMSESIRIERAGAPLTLDVDGPSLGLASTVAFLARWAHEPSKLDGVLVTARVEGVRIIPVADETLAPKLAAASEVEGLRLVLVAPSQLESARALVGPNVEVRGPATVQEAADLLGFDLSRAGDPLQSNGQAWLERLMEQLEAQVVSDQADPWGALASELKLALARYEQQHPDGPLIPRARVRVGVACLHANSLREANEVVRAALADEAERANDADRALSTEDRAWLRILALLERVRSTPDITVERALDAELARLEGELRGDERRRQRGRVLGTRGFWRLMRHRELGDDPQGQLAVLAEADDALRAALDHYRRLSPQREPRSLLYVAQGRRWSYALAGTDEAGHRFFESLSEAFVSVEERWREFPEFRFSLQLTHAFLYYELARGLLDRAHLHGEPERAFCTRALDACARGLEACTPFGPVWPRGGLLRSMAWAQRALGLDEQARETLELLDATLRASGDDAPEREIEFARAGYRRDGPVR